MMLGLLAVPGSWAGDVQARGAPITATSPGASEIGQAAPEPVKPAVQQTQNPRADSGTSVPLPGVVVTGERNEERNVLPTHAQVDSLFGTPLSVLDTPRSVSVLTPEIMRDRAVITPGDLAKVSPDTFAPNVFGYTGVPFIRGDEGEIYQDGIRRIVANNGFGLPLSFNSAEQIDVVKGPAPVVLGPTQRVAGHIDLVSKQPDFDKVRGVGEVDGGSWNRYRAIADISHPLDHGISGVRVSYEGRREGSYYDFVHFRSDDVYAVVASKLSDRARIDLNVEYYRVDFSDNSGINRPTQNLIDNGVYITGTGISPDPNYGAEPGPDAVVSPTGQTRIPRHRVFTDPLDFARAETLRAGSTLRVDLGEGAGLTNRLYYQHLRKDQVEQKSFVEIIPADDQFEDRTEFDIHFPLSVLGLDTRSDIVTGTVLRITRVVGFSQFDTESFNAIDLTGPISNRREPVPSSVQAQLVQLRPGVFVSPGAEYGSGNYLISDTSDSNAYQGGLFYQHALHLGQKWFVIGALRGDWIGVSARDPLPPPGFTPARAGAIHFMRAANASITYKPRAWMAWYAATSFSQSTVNSLGQAFQIDPTDNTLPVQDFHTGSHFWETGAKFGEPQGTWYAATDLFWQTRNLHNRDDSNSGIKTQGAELEGQYQPISRLYATASISYLDAHYNHSVAFQQTRAVVDAFDNSRPDIIQGTGIGSPNFTAFGPGNETLEGLPSLLINANVSYELVSGLGANAGVVWTNKYRLDYLGTVHIPAQYTLDAGVHYTFRQSTELRLDGYNITNERNWSPIFMSYFGADAVMPDLPVNFMLSIRHRFD